MKVKPSSKRGRVVMEIDREEESLLESRSGEQRVPFKLQSILVPIDFSDCSKKALHYAVPFAKQFGAALTLLHVVQVYYPVPEFGAIDYAALEKQMRDRSQTQIDQMGEAEVDPEIGYKTRVVTGHPAREIVRIAQEEGYDLILLSTHGHTGFKHLVLGSTTENVVRYAPCPVLVVRVRERDFTIEPQETRV